MLEGSAIICSFESDIEGGHGVDAVYETLSVGSGHHDEVRERRTEVQRGMMP